MSIGERIKKERRRLNLNQEDFSTFIGASKRVVVSWEKNVALPNGKYLVAMSEHGADVQYILTGNRSINLHGTGREISFSDGISLSKERLKTAVETCEIGLDAADKTVNATQKAELIVAIYQLLNEEAQLTKSKHTPENVINIMQAIA